MVSLDAWVYACYFQRKHFITFPPSSLMYLFVCTALRRSWPLLGLVLLLTLNAQAQPGSGGVTPTPTPLDGGASLLLASGVAYGLKRLRRRV